MNDKFRNIGNMVNKVINIKEFNTIEYRSSITMEIEICL